MALRIKTVEYAFAQSIAAVATATARDFLQLAALAIPESASRTFRSVTLEVAATDNGAAAASVSAVLIGIALGAVGRNDATVTFTLTNSGENQAWLFTRDVTSYFQTNYSGTSMTADCRLTITGLASINANAKLIITYEYDDAAASTRIKTVKIPIDGNITNLTTSFVNIGGVASQIPNLSTFLPEASKVFRSIFFEINSNTGTSAAATSNLDISYDGGATTVSDTSWAFTLISDVMTRRIDNLTATLATNAAGSIQAKCISATACPYPCLNGVLVVTYEYDHSASTQIMNSIQFTCLDEGSWLGGIATGDKSRFVKELWIEEPGAITLAQSAIMLSYNASGGPVVDHRAGSQASRTFTHGSTAHCGGMTHMRRLDSGGAGGVAGCTIGRGKNSIVLDLFATSATAGNIPSNASALCFLNYLSDKHALGDGVHNHTTHWMVRPYATGGAVQRLQSAVAITPNIPEAAYWLGAVSYQIILQTMTTTPAPYAIAFQCECQAGEAEGAGWHDLYVANYESDAEMGFSLSYARGRTDFLRWPADWDTGGRLNIETARDYRFDSAFTGVAVFQAAMLLTHHAITFTAAGTVSGSAGGTVNIDLHMQSTGEEVAATTRTGNGPYSLTWYDNTQNVYADAWESGALLGRSDYGTAS